jgi:hypothetical protein
MMLQKVLSALPLVAMLQAAEPHKASRIIPKRDCDFGLLRLGRSMVRFLFINQPPRNAFILPFAYTHETVGHYVTQLLKKEKIRLALSVCPSSSYYKRLGKKANMISRFALTPSTLTFTNPICFRKFTSLTRVL